ncbi:MAG: type IX secretion system sortase PorU [candidate division Zixibacteria bacterium]|nr:type IX secretion system sortase PorU [candidate division Zixibacteria bacterium]
MDTKNYLSPLRLFIAILVFLTIGASVSAYAASSTRSASINILSSDYNGIRFVYQPGTVKLERINSDDDSFDRLSVSEGYSLQWEGYPSLPVKNFYIALPPNSSPSVSVHPVGGGEVFKNLKISGMSNSETLRGKTDALVSKVVERIRNLDVMKITVAAASYDSDTRTASAYKEIEISVRFKASGFQRRYSVAEDRFAVRVLKNLILNYNQSKGWHYRLSAEELLPVGSPFDSSSNWYVIRTNDEGIYKIGYYTLTSSGIQPSQIDPGTVRMFGSANTELPVDNSDPYPMLQEMPIHIAAGNDGSFDEDDYIYFFAPALNRYAYDSTKGRDIFDRHHYETQNVFFLTFGTSQFHDAPLRWQNLNVDVVNPSIFNITSFEDFIRVEEDRQLPTDEGGGITDFFEWVWEWGNPFNRYTGDQLYNVIQGEPGYVYSHALTGEAMLRVNGELAERISYTNFITTSGVDNFRNGLNELEFSYAEDVNFDYFDVRYTRGLEVVGDELLFRAPEDAGTYIFNLRNADPSMLLLDITDPLFPMKLNGGTLDNNVWKFQYSSDGMATRFFYSTPESYLNVSSIEVYTPVDLRSVSNQADNIIITYDGFRSEAERLASHRSTYSGLNCIVVNLTDVYMEFGWGRSDALSIRYFLRYAFEHWSDPKPFACTLIGDGHYDYLGIMDLGIPVYIPPYEYPVGGNPAWASDDNYIFFGDYGKHDSDTSGFPDMVIGRLSVRSNQQLAAIVDKLITYDTGSQRGEWNNTIAVVADDQFGDKTESEWFHTNQAETLQRNHIPGSFKVNKIYAIDYPMEEGRTKPLVNQSILNAFNSGSLIINYIGHGSKNVWMHEHTFRKTEDIPRLTNETRLPLVIGASCSIGEYDDPIDEAMGEELVRKDGGGACAVVAATRGVFAGENAELNNTFFDYLLVTDSLTIAEALYLAKLERSNSSNDRRYMLFGDPTQMLAIPKLQVDITSVSTGSAEDTLNGLGLVTVEANVVDRNGSPVSDFNGVVYLTAYDATKSIPFGPFYTYYLPGNLLFRGPADVVNGNFSVNFLMPKDIDYGKSSAKIIAYVQDDNQMIDGSGYRDNLYLGRASETPLDSIGPEITLYIDGNELQQNFISVGSDFELMAVVSDSSGINMTGQTGHYMSLLIDDGETLNENITDNFQYDMNDYQTGSLEYSVEDLEGGDHTVALKVWDNFNNSSLKTFTVNVISQESTELLDVMNYPNPFEDRTVIQYRLNRPDVTEAEVKIFTLSGLWIRTIKNCPTDNSYNYVEWNGRDADGDEVANGVYIYKVTANGPGGESESFQKALKLR